MRSSAIWLLALAGCGAGLAPAPAGGSASVSAAAAPAPQREQAVPEPYRPPPEPPEPSQPPIGRLSPRAELFGAPPIMRPAEPRLPLVERWLPRLDRAGLDIAESELWEPCVRDFVGARPEPARRALTAALARYQTACAPGGGVALQGVRGLDGRARRGRTDVGFTGTLSATRLDVSLRVAYCGGALEADRIAITADGARWTSPRLSFARVEPGCQAAELPWTRALARAVWAAAVAGDAAIVFEGGAQELALPDETKQHLRAMLEALEALEPPEAR